MEKTGGQNGQFSDWKAFLTSGQWKALEDIGRQMEVGGRRIVQFTRDQWLSTCPMDGD